MIFLQDQSAGLCISLQSIELCRFRQETEACQGLTMVEIWLGQLSDEGHMDRTGGEFAE
jgi:hypothetical protein